MPSKYLNLRPYQITRPEKTLWRFAHVSNEEELLLAIKSKSLRSFLRKVDATLERNQVRCEQGEISATEFQNWLDYYRSKMTENEFEVIASPEWYVERKELGRKIEKIFFYQQDQLIGSGIVTKEDGKRITLAFKASDRLDLSNEPNSSIGAVVDFFFLRTGVREQFPIISSGRSRNAFGVINTLGYLDYRLRFGYCPTQPEDSPVLDEVPVNEEGVVIFFGYQNSQYCMFAVVPEHLDIKFDQARFATPELPFVEICYSPSTLLEH